MKDIELKNEWGEWTDEAYEEAYSLLEDVTSYLEDHYKTKGAMMLLERFKRFNW